MNRRGFLAALAAAFVVDPERLLWVPRARVISIPSPVISIPSPEASAIFVQQALSDGLQLGDVLTFGKSAADRWMVTEVYPPGGKWFCRMDPVK